MSQQKETQNKFKLLQEFSALEKELKWENTLSPIEVIEDEDIIDEVFFIPDSELIEEALPDTQKIPSLEAEMTLRQEDPFQTPLFFTEDISTQEIIMTLPTLPLEKE